MTIEKVSFSKAPEKITVEKYDCIWVAFSSRLEPSKSVMASPALQWLDWKLQGQLSKSLWDRKYKGTTFIPTMKKVSTPYLALDGASGTDWEGFLKTCEGLRLKSVLFFCEDPTKVSEIERQFKKKSASFPETLSLGTDA